MKKNYFLILMLLPMLGFSQGKLFWKQSNKTDFQPEELLERSSTPVVYELYTLDLNSLKQLLAAAPDRDLNIKSEIVVQFPGAEGKMENFEVYNASIMEPTFAANYPDIQSYVAISRENTGTVIRFSTTIFGFHATVHAIGKTMYIDPFTTDLGTYVMYAKADLYSDVQERLGCLVEDSGNANRTGSNASETPAKNANDGQLRTFRLALACTQEYANYHIDAAGQSGATDAVKRATVLAAMNVSMTRVNAVFERDMSLTMTLVDNTSIIFLAENDGYTDSNAGQLINQNVAIVNANIGVANYDIGHVFTTGGGGLAALGGICFSNNKAAGVTGSGNPVGDPFDIDFVAHEMGHQFGAPHTFNGSQGNCSGGNRNAATAVEPGSGTTIMAYAGICGSDNVQNNSDDHFHAISIDNMWNRLNQNPTCSNNTANGNTAPTVDAGPDYTIPYGTAFTLTGSATDPDGTTLSYCWEQVDAGVIAGVPNTTSTTDPQFRSYSPVATGDRTFPRLEDILNDNLTPAWEVIPNVARVMDFALTVRDNGTPNGGQTNRDDMRVTLANTGPFRVTAPDTTNESFDTNSTTTITWDVAGTTANGINTSNVNILLSTDGGQTFPTVLAANTANDGSESITFPVIFEPYCRIKIEAVGNIFFAISKSFSVGATVSTSTDCNTYTTGSIATAIPDGSGANQQGNAVATPAITVTETTAITDIRVTTDITHSYIGDLYLRLQSPNSGPFADFWIRSCNTAQFGNINATFRDGEASITCASPTVGTFAPPANSLLATLGGINPSGDWILVAADFYNGDTGVINEVSIELCTTTTTVTLSNEEFELENFTLYPNPNKGEFSLSFNSTSGEDINIDVHDISGRLIYTKGYNATSNFDENISLKNVSTGMYLITVTDQERTVTKKLIVE
ncbi:reprolysin-like metallopeptidase [Kordia sp.]|uniref:reprolysin-like metallopeptidase n=1 Tax=Kordia sp. TaxID=1965332 RepID=UPI0025C4ADE6|nr:zinc-dependent metalloprotease family protein [Kordia sp.]MCH2193114.1 M12 family metallo-peptidase [Kordia sp.]